MGFRKIEPESVIDRVQVLPTDLPAPRNNHPLVQAPLYVVPSVDQLLGLEDVVHYDEVDLPALQLGLPIFVLPEILIN